MRRPVDDEKNRDLSRASLPSIPELKEPSFVEEARTLEVFVRAPDSALAPHTSAANRALLLRMDGLHAGSVIAIERLPFTLGRHPTNTLRIDEESISRFHARIVRDEAERYVIEDLDSRNGTFVSAARIKRKILEDGSSLTFGAQASFRFNITDSRQEDLLRQLYESSTRDALTGSYNRSHFEERLRTELAYAARHRTEMSLVLLDIDHFKRVNDTYGHPAGDLVLRELAKLAHRSLRTEDVFARFGGEEFAVVLRGIHLSGARKLAERLRVGLERATIAAEDEHIHVTLSAGCASLACAPQASAEELVRLADRRLYAAKGSGRNRVVAEG